MKKLILATLFLLGCGDEVHPFPILPTPGLSYECGDFRMDGLWRGDLWRSTVDVEGNEENIFLDDLRFNVRSTGCATNFDGTPMLATHDKLIRDEVYTVDWSTEEEEFIVHYSHLGICNTTGCVFSTFLEGFSDGVSVATLSSKTLIVDLSRDE